MAVVPGAGHKFRRQTVPVILLGILSASCILVTACGRASKLTMFGFNSPVTPGSVRLQQATGMAVRRMFVYWNQVEPSRGQWNWRHFDAQYDQLLRAGLKPEITLFGSPCWSRPDVVCNDAAYTGPPDPIYERDWIQFVHEAAQRYRRDVGFEIWSEPNLVWFFYPRIDPVRYARLLGEAYRAIKSVNEAIPVAAAGLAVAGTAGGATLDYRQFIADSYAAGAGSVMNAISIHIYPTVKLSNGQSQWNPTAFEQVLGALRAVRRRYGRHQSIWVSEAGESTGEQSHRTAGLSPQQQAADLMTIIETARRDQDVQMLLIHTVQDAPAMAANPYNVVDQGWGVFTANGTPKPAACALSAAFDGSLHCLV